MSGVSRRGVVVAVRVVRVVRVGSAGRGRKRAVGCWRVR